MTVNKGTTEAPADLTPGTIASEGGTTTITGFVDGKTYKYGTSSEGPYDTSLDASTVLAAGTYYVIIVSSDANLYNDSTATPVTITPYSSGGTTA